MTDVATSDGDKPGATNLDSIITHALAERGDGCAAATAPGLPVGQGIWGWVPSESAPTYQALPSRRRRPPTSDRQTTGPGIEATTEAAGRTVPTWHRAGRPAQMNVRGRADYEIQASL